MARSQAKSKRKASGGRYTSGQSKKHHELAGFPALTKLADEKRTKQKRTIGGNSKRVLLQGKEINVADQKGKTQKTEIVTVVENPSNPHLVRRNILTKGAVVETKMGKARVT
ncbi:30S ribosomal protein S8e, partial [Candidatus Woesearchaeota archaeon]|nr:30S ribosomal protein S8e [Candidatus Woesearchaeota archaeon]